MLIQLINSGLRKIPTWVLYILLPIPGILAIVAGLTDNLGPEPIKELEGELGEVAIKLLILYWIGSRLLPQKWIISDAYSTYKQRPSQDPNMGALYPPSHSWDIGHRGGVNR